MHGYPSTIATRQDVVNLLAEERYAARALAYLQILLDERYGWVLQGQIPLDAPAPTVAGHKIEDVADEAGTVTQRYLYQWMVSPHTALDRLGVTAAEAVAWGCVDQVVEAPGDREGRSGVQT
uniref:Uncharacterized protein n=1 Tax=Desulfovibrio sp. U5L TaxID=596152 RepID=I2Q013_9BACT